MLMSAALVVVIKNLISGEVWLKSEL
jgi:hypothetical protein